MRRNGPDLDFVQKIFGLSNRVKSRFDHSPLKVREIIAETLVF